VTVKVEVEELEEGESEVKDEGAMAPPTYNPKGKRQVRHTDPHAADAYT
jgi:hypothetical protein